MNKILKLTTILAIILCSSITFACPRCGTLLPVSGATHTAIGGNWLSPATWDNGIPTDGAQVVIPEGVTVTLNGNTNKLRWVRLDGTLNVSLNVDTALNVHTIVGGAKSVLEIGTPASPVTAKHTTTYLAGPFLEGDYEKITLGFSTSGKVIVNGISKTEWTTLEVGSEAKVGDTTLKLASVPLKWNVGDRLLLAGTDSRAGPQEQWVQYQSEEFTIAAIAGNVVTLNKPCVYRHYPWRSDLLVHVANLTRNIVFKSEFAAPIMSRGHFMLHKGPPSVIRYAEFRDMGRTDKSQVVTDPRLDVIEGTLIPGSDLNPRARYGGPHAHRKGSMALPEVWRGLVIDGSPGWGLVNHASNCQVDTCIAVRCFGFGLGSEEGQERGWFRHCLAGLNRGLGEVIVSTDADHGVPIAADWGKDGAGFWLQGPMVEVSDCVSFDNSGRGFALFNRQFNVNTQNIPEYLRYPVEIPGELLPLEYLPKISVPSDAVPFQKFARNTAYQNKVGVQSWSFARHHTGIPGFPEVFPPAGVRAKLYDTTLWGRGAMLHMEYTSQYEVDGLRVIGDMSFRTHPSISKFTAGAVRLRGNDAYVRWYEITGMRNPFDMDVSPTEHPKFVIGPGTFQTTPQLVPGVALNHPNIEIIQK